METRREEEKPGNVIQVGRQQIACLEREAGQEGTVRRTGRATDTVLKGMQGNFIVILQQYLLLLTRRVMIDDSFFFFLNETFS